MNTPVETLMQYILMLKNNGVSDTRVLQAMELIPREPFTTPAFLSRAYEDTALPIASGQTLSQPSVVAKMTQALDVGPRHKVLEIGTGTGFQAAVLSQLARRVYTIERFADLARNANQTLLDLELVNVTVITGDGSHGLPTQSPFDRIILTAAAEDPPANLLAQLKEGGIMVLPVGQSSTVQTLIKITKTDTGLEYEELEDVRFVPLLAGLA
ncbi:protein-L-isoaspartate O-methyltransferase [Amylibacter marinus]|uniref:Protein-L-isoaspartate O-methyltransferase n=1 Tax=Amylibacter marinus TaxID=1475483 RepID=A0ABQ5VTN6_9RHOB|nr:protein-L-isoaspartate(D-aspartate) O-methyltransferase [Amylibacter marinus]GLQ34741.1 protein-L-isoaspartate O-methyltransferase [Amylibacter marinus]